MYFISIKLTLHYRGIKASELFTKKTRIDDYVALSMSAKELKVSPASYADDSELGITLDSASFTCGHLKKYSFQNIV